MGSRQLELECQTSCLTRPGPPVDGQAGGVISIGREKRNLDHDDAAAASCARELCSNSAQTPLPVDR